MQATSCVLTGDPVLQENCAHYPDGSTDKIYSDQPAQTHKPTNPQKNQHYPTEKQVKYAIENTSMKEKEQNIEPQRTASAEGV
jgi:hypothetical protein